MNLYSKKKGQRNSENIGKRNKLILGQELKRFENRLNTEEYLNVSAAIEDFLKME